MLIWNFLCEKNEECRDAKTLVNQVRSERFKHSTEAWAEQHPPQKDGQWKSSKPTNLKVHYKVSSYQFPIHRKLDRYPSFSISAQAFEVGSGGEETRNTVYSVFLEVGSAEQGANHRRFFPPLPFLFLLRITDVINTTSAIWLGMSGFKKKFQISRDSVTEIERDVLFLFFVFHCTTSLLFIEKHSFNLAKRRCVASLVFRRMAGCCIIPGCSCQEHSRPSIGLTFYECLHTPCLLKWKIVFLCDANRWTH